MFNLLKYRSGQRVTTWVLVALQIHLLMVLVLHHHAVPNILLEPASADVGHANPHSQPCDNPQTYCTACQILRHSAVRPALGNSTPRYSVAVSLIADCCADKVLSNQPITLCGRSPPRS